MATKLTGKQEKFAQLVSVYGEQSKAYREAYPKSKKWKDTAVWSQASRLMTNGMVSARVAELREKVKEKTGLDAEWVLKGFQDMHKYCTDKETRDNANANRALEDIGKHLGMFVDRKAWTDENGKDIIVPLFMLALDKAYGSN